MKWPLCPGLFAPALLVLETSARLETWTGFVIAILKNETFFVLLLFRKHLLSFWKRLEKIKFSKTSPVATNVNAKRSNINFQMVIYHGQNPASRRTHASPHKSSEKATQPPVLKCHTVCSPLQREQQSL